MKASAPTFAHCQPEPEHMTTIEAHNRDGIFTTHSLPETLVDLGEIEMNYVITGSPDKPALLLVPAQTESWWGYESVIPLLVSQYQVFAVDLRGQGRSTQTPGRYTLDNMGNDLVRFLDLVVSRPVVVSGCSSGGLLAAWLAAYAKPGQIRGAALEDPPLFASESSPACGHSMLQSMGPFFAHLNKYLGDQWSIGDWAGMLSAAERELPSYVVAGLRGMRLAEQPESHEAAPPPQNMKEYDPEWARSFWTGFASASCDHARMLAGVKTPILLTHHYREIDPESGSLMGAASADQIRRAGELVRSAGQRFEHVDLPEMPHILHAHEPDRFVRILLDWASSLGAA